MRELPANKGSIRSAIGTILDPHRSNHQGLTCYGHWEIHRTTLAPDATVSVSFARSSTLLYYLRTLRHPFEPQMAFLGVGAVPYELELPSSSAQRGIMRAVGRGVYTVSGMHLYRLPLSRQEVLGAEQSLNHLDRSVALLGPDATESKFKSQPLGNFKILHFAVHGLSDPQFPDRAALVLGRDPNSNDDGLLERVAQSCAFCKSAALPVFLREKPQTSGNTRSALPDW